MSNGDQQVFVVDREACFGGNWPAGFAPLPSDPANWLQQAFERGRFVDRATAEQNPAWKQWIPYCLLRCGDWRTTGDPAERGIFVVRRTRGQSEARLHESRSIGIGGHIEPIDDADGRDERDPQRAAAFFRKALERELAEELAFAEAGELAPPELVGHRQ